MALMSLCSPTAQFTSSVPSALVDENGSSRAVMLHLQLEAGKARLVIDEDGEFGRSWSLVVTRDAVTCFAAFLEAVEAHRRKQTPVVVR